MDTVQLVPSDLESRVLTILREHRGRQAAIGKAELAKQTGVCERTVRDLIKHLIEEHHEPIGSCSGAPGGYFYINSPAELDLAMHELRTRIIEIAKRMSHLKKNSLADVLGQLAMELR
ncbi:MAG TPA: hypothetical protein PKN47_01755 [Nitrospira sp.]|nr:hypothetical protein [Nitrospira sp.]